MNRYAVTLAAALALAAPAAHAQEPTVGRVWKLFAIEDPQAGRLFVDGYVHAYQKRGCKVPRNDLVRIAQIFVSSNDREWFTMRISDWPLFEQFTPAGSCDWNPRVEPWPGQCPSYSTAPMCQPDQKRARP